MISPLITNSFVTPVGRKKHPMNTGAITSTRRISDVDIGKATKVNAVNSTIRRNTNEATTYH
jgi:hypothetical protein